MWGYYMQGSDQLVEVDELGSQLSLIIGCAVHYPAYAKNMFECRCGVCFPVGLVRGFIKYDKPIELLHKHEQEAPLMKQYAEER